VKRPPNCAPSFLDPPPTIYQGALFCSGHCGRLGSFLSCLFFLCTRRILGADSYFFPLILCPTCPFPTLNACSPLFRFPPLLRFFSKIPFPGSGETDDRRPDLRPNASLSRLPAPSFSRLSSRHELYQRVRSRPRFLSIRAWRIPLSPLTRTSHGFLREGLVPPRNPSAPQSHSFGRAAVPLADRTLDPLSMP